MIGTGNKKPPRKAACGHIRLDEMDSTTVENAKNTYGVEMSLGEARKALTVRCMVMMLVCT